MKHNEASESYAAERYILGEMQESERDSFEEHFFECKECARNLGALEIFLANARAVFDDRSRPAVVTGSFWRRHGQQFTALAAGLLLAVGTLTIYQNLVTIPRLGRMAAIAQAPRAYQSYLLRDTSRTTDDTFKLKIGPTNSKSVGFRIDQPDETHSKYRVEFAPSCGPVAGKTAEWDDPTPGLAFEFSVLESELVPGTCQVTLYALSPSGWEKIKASSFEIIRTEE